jgi:aminoglycoside 6-adenylyltransferase
LIKNNLTHLENDMRKKREMLDLILDTAKNDDRVRAVVMNGSRANPNAPRDVFQDYDIVYFVTDMTSFTTDHSWIDHFGERMILQMPDEMGNPQVRDTFHFSYLIQFMDGNRIDLTLYPVAKLDQHEKDSLTILLLDKDGLFDTFPQPSDSDYLPQPPTAKQFAESCNEFWWVSLYVAKGLWRQQLTYAKHAMDNTVRQELIKMLSWYVGGKTKFSQNLGGYGKFLQTHLESDLWARLEKTYADADYENNWNALLAMTDLFRQTAKQVAIHHGFDYQSKDDERVSNHILYVRDLPRDATDMKLP